MGFPAAYVNAVLDAVAPLGVRNLEMPIIAGLGGDADREGGGLVTLDVLELARSTAEREPCVLATVVWRRVPPRAARAARP